MAVPESCATFFSSCADKFKNMSWDMFWKMLIATDSNGCPAIRVTGISGGGSGGAVTLPSTVRTVSRTVDAVSGNKTVASGSRSVTIELSNDFVGSLLGDNTVIPGASYNFAVQQNDDVLGAIAYVVTSGSVTITKIV